MASSASKLFEDILHIVSSADRCGKNNSGNWVVVLKPAQRVCSWETRKAQWVVLVREAAPRQ